MKIAPCPFCKSEDVHVGPVDDSGKWFSVVCDDCLGEGPNVTDQENAVARWNNYLNTETFWK